MPPLFLTGFDIIYQSTHTLRELCHAGITMHRKEEMRVKSLTPNDVGILFNLLSPENRDLFFDLLKDLAEHEAESPDAPDQEHQKAE